MVTSERHRDNLEVSEHRATPSPAQESSLPAPPAPLTRIIQALVSKPTSVYNPLPVNCWLHKVKWHTSHVLNLEEAGGEGCS